MEAYGVLRDDAKDLEAARLSPPQSFRMGREIMGGKRKLIGCADEMKLGRIMT